MKYILFYILFVFEKLVNLLSVQLFPDFPVTIFQFICSIVIIIFIFKFIFGGTREFDTFLNLSIRDTSRTISHLSRKEQIVARTSKEAVPVWLNKEIKSNPATPEEKAEIDSMLAEFK